MTATSQPTQTCDRRADQQLLFDCGELATRDGKVATKSSVQKAREQCKRPASRDNNGTAEIFAAIRDVAEQLSQRLTAIEVALQAIVSQSAASTIAKEFYTTKEAAVILGKRPYTVREWCRLGRVHGEKAEFGRGLDDEWRISHAELIRIQNEGLLSVQKYARVTAPKRLAQ
jgi:hypothetical protein